MIKDPEQALLNLINAVEKTAAQLPKSKERAALMKASYEARQHLRIPFIDPEQAGRNAAKAASERAQSLREAAMKHLTQPVSEQDIENILDRTYGLREEKVVDLFPKKREDPIARAVRISKQIKPQ